MDKEIERIKKDSQALCSVARKMVAISQKTRIFARLKGENELKLGNSVFLCLWTLGNKSNQESKSGFENQYHTERNGVNLEDYGE